MKLKTPGDSNYLLGEIVDKIDLDGINDEFKKRRKKNLATAEECLLGITKASLQTNSFISAASFKKQQECLPMLQ